MLTASRIWTASAAAADEAPHQRQSGWSIWSTPPPAFAFAQPCPENGGERMIFD